MAESKKHHPHKKAHHEPEPEEQDEELQVEVEPEPEDEEEEEETHPEPPKEEPPAAQKPVPEDKPETLVPGEAVKLEGAVPFDGNTALENLKRMGVVPIGTGTAGKVLKPDEAPSGIQHLGRYANPNPLTPSEAVEKFGGDAVRMVFPHSMNLVTDDRTVIEYRTGVHDVPKELADHEYLKANGVTELKVEGEPREPIKELVGHERMVAGKR